MAKADIAAKIRQKFGFTARESAEILGTVLEIVKKTLESGDYVKIASSGNSEGMRGMNRIDDKEHVFYVRDNGKGIDPCFHEKIFGLFNKLDTKSQGSDVGLALVKRDIEAHGGRVWVESEGVDKGSFFA